MQPVSPSHAQYHPWTSRVSRAINFLLRLRFVLTRNTHLINTDTRCLSFLELSTLHVHSMLVLQYTTYSTTLICYTLKNYYMSSDLLRMARWIWFQLQVSICGISLFIIVLRWLFLCKYVIFLYILILCFSILNLHLQVSKSSVPLVDELRLQTVLLCAATHALTSSIRISSVSSPQHTKSLFEKP